MNISKIEKKIVSQLCIPLGVATIEGSAMDLHSELLCYYAYGQIDAETDKLTDLIKSAGKINTAQSQKEEECL